MPKAVDETAEHVGVAWLPRCRTVPALVTTGPTIHPPGRHTAGADRDRPERLWCRKVTQLRGPQRGVNYERPESPQFNLYVLLDICSPFVVALTVAVVSARSSQAGR